MEIIQIVCDDNIYYFSGNNFFDEFFIALEGDELRKVAHEYFNSIPYQTLNSQEFLAFVKQVKNCGLIYKAKKVIEFAIVHKGNDVQLLHSLLPIYTSCCRILNQPETAIECAEHLLPICGGSCATYTSLAAAYCDIQDYKNAKKYAGIAYAKQGGGKGYQTEISLVFKRLKKETGETPDNKEE